jgi:superfamily II DNA or RNA helicase
MPPPSAAELADAIGYTWMCHQAETLDAWVEQDKPVACLYYRTGGGKTITSLAMLRLKGVEEALIVAPPTTHDTWHIQAALLDIKIEVVSHEKFRMPSYKLSRFKAIVVDEVHKLGRNTGQGWKKLDALGRRIQAPLIVCSATPNYNDADRAYCIVHVLEPEKHSGGLLQFISNHCTTEVNPFSVTPKVTGFIRYDDVTEFLVDQPYVYWLQDDTDYTIQDDVMDTLRLPWLDKYGFDMRDNKMMASQIEEKHLRIIQDRTLTPGARLSRPAEVWLIDLVRRYKGQSILIYATHKEVARAALGTLDNHVIPAALITGDSTEKEKHERISNFRNKKVPILIGTATLGTGTDGLDKVCDTLLILDDTDDDAFRRQLIGRIMPRGLDSDASNKNVHRLLFQ